jgi:hypothetical protein
VTVRRIKLGERRQSSFEQDEPSGVWCGTLFLLREDTENGGRDPIYVFCVQLLVDWKFEAVAAPTRNLLCQCGRTSRMGLTPQVHTLYAKSFKGLLESYLIRHDDWKKKRTRSCRQVWKRD